MEELRMVHKLHNKMMSGHCQDITPEQGKLLYLIRNEKMNQKENCKTSSYYRGDSFSKNKTFG